MSQLDGTYDVVANTPIGDQSMTITIRTEGDTFTGRSEGQMGASEIAGTVSGNTLAWKQDISVPMPLELNCAATINGDRFEGTIDTGAFGSFDVAGSRAA